VAKKIALGSLAAAGTYVTADRTVFEPERRKIHDAVTSFLASPGDQGAEKQFETMLKERYGTTVADVRNVQRSTPGDGRTVSRLDVTFGRTNNENMPRGLYSMEISQSRDPNGAQVVSLSSPSLAQSVPVTSSVTDGMTYPQARAELEKIGASTSQTRDRDLLALLQTTDPEQQKAILSALGVTDPKRQQELMAQFAQEGPTLLNAMERGDALNVQRELQHLVRQAPKASALSSALSGLLIPASNVTGLGQDQAHRLQSLPTLTSMLEKQDREKYQAVVNSLPAPLKAQYERLFNQMVDQELKTSQELSGQDSANGLPTVTVPTREQIVTDLQRMETLEGFIRQYPKPFSEVTQLLQNQQDSANAAGVLLRLQKQNPQLFEQLQHQLNQQAGTQAVQYSLQNNPRFDPNKASPNVPQFLPQIETNVTVGQLRRLIDQAPNAMTAVQDAINRQQNIAGTSSLLTELQATAPQEYAAVERHLQAQNLWGSFNSQPLQQVVSDLRERNPDGFSLYRLMASNYDRLAEQQFATARPETATVYLSNGEQPVITQIITQPNNTARVNTATFSPLNMNPDFFGQRVNTTAPGINIGMGTEARSINPSEVNPDMVGAINSNSPKDSVWSMLKSYGTAYQDGAAKYGVIGFTDDQGHQITMHVLSDGSVIHHNASGSPTRYAPEQAGTMIQEGLKRGWQIQNNRGLILGQRQN
jgi:hypothetical protein